jgi:hypothetical protein
MYQVAQKREGPMKNPVQIDPDFLAQILHERKTLLAAVEALLKVLERQKPKRAKP